MVDSPLITCIIPTYRRPRMLARAIRSVLNQTFPSLRVLVTDNASGDETASVVRAIQDQDPRVVYHCQPRNLGMNANFAYGMSRVETSFYSLLSDDDILLPEFYEIAYAEFQKYPQAIFVATHVPHVTNDGRYCDHLSLWDRDGLFSPPTGAYRVAGIWDPTITGILFRREFLEKAYAYPDPNIHRGDFEMVFNAAYHHFIAVADKPGALFISHNEPRAKPEKPFSKVYHALQVISRVDNDVNFPMEFKVRTRIKWTKYISYHLSGLIVSMIIDKDFITAKKGIHIMKDKSNLKYLSTTLNIFLYICQLFPIIGYLSKILYPYIHRLLNNIITSASPILNQNIEHILKSYNIIEV